MALKTPTYGYAYHDAAVDGLTRLSRHMGLSDGGAPGGLRWRTLSCVVNPVGPQGAGLRSQMPAAIFDPRMYPEQIS